MAGRDAEFERDIEAEQGYLDWALRCLDAALSRAESGPWNDEGPVDRVLKRMREEKAVELRAARHALLIGRLDIRRSSEVGGTWYIGRTDVADETYDTVVVDWRSDLGGRFYQAGHGNPLDVGRRRTFGTDGNRITSLSDEMLIKNFSLAMDGDSEVAPEPKVQQPHTRETGAIESPEPAVPVPVPDDGQVGASERLDDLRAPDLLLAELERDRTEHMQEIVTTIQADQDRLIRRDPSVPLIVQGGPGTGKTVVGLHRAAYLLYRQREGSLEQSMLIVGPNSAFMDYIGAVLPTLGETNSRQLTTEELLLSGQRAADQRVLRGQLRASDGDAAARVKGSPTMATVVKRAVWAQAAPKEVSASFRAMSAELDAETVHGLIEELAQSRSYDDARREIESRLARALTEVVVARAASLDRTLFTPDVQAFTAAAAEQLKADRIRNALLPAVTAPAVLDRLLGDSDFIDTIAAELLPEADRVALYRPTARAAEGRGRHRSTADLALLDEIADVIGAEIEKFDHLIVDEAQDLSPMQWRAIKRRTRGGGITILGDLAQGTAACSPDSWQQVQDVLGYPAPDVVQELRLGYRVPKPILDFAARLLPVAAPDVVRPESFREGEAPRFHRVEADDLWDWAFSLVGAAGGRTALIAPRDLVVPLMARAGGLGSRNVAPPSILPPEGAKGLEFDQVIVLEPARLGSRDQRGYRQMYVALTRSTKRLDIVHSEDLPAVLEGQLPGVFDPAVAGQELRVSWEADPGLSSLPILIPRPSEAMPEADPEVASPVEDAREPAAEEQPVSDDQPLIAGAAWFDDPVSRFTYRYWDGEQWTGWVAAVSGAVAADPAPVGSVPEPSAEPASIVPIGLPLGVRPSADAGAGSGAKAFRFTLEECRVMLADTTYEADPRNAPDERRRVRFAAGWEAAASGRTYTDATLKQLKWDNLGWRLGVRFGAQPQDAIDAAFDSFAALWHADRAGGDSAAPEPSKPSGLY